MKSLRFLYSRMTLIAVAAASGALTLLPAPRVAHAIPSAISAATAGAAPQTLENPGFPAAHFYKPRSGRKMKPVVVYLHGRGGNPEEGCRQWAKVATEFGWLLCPAGQEDRGPGSRGWGNDPINSQKNVMGALTALRAKFGRKVQLYGNVLIGFSEGAFIAQNVGQKDPKTFNRWLIVASCDRYFGYDKTVLEEARKKLKRIYLWTGENDMVVKESTATFEHLRSLKVKVKLNVAQGYGHEIPAATMTQNYRKALRWLVAAK